MERLTKYICERAHGAEGVSENKLTGSYCRGQFEATALVERLSNIEDILGDTYNIDRLRELVEADKQGRALIVTDEMATAMRAGALVLGRKGVKQLIGTGLNWMPREGKYLYIPYRKAADVLKEAAYAALAKEAENG